VTLKRVNPSGINPISVTQSVAGQYNSTIAQTRYHPRILRTECGKETPLMLKIHFLVARTSESNIKLEEYYFYSTSWKNQRFVLRGGIVWYCLSQNHGDS
jgi:hypothetical protein